MAVNLLLSYAFHAETDLSAVRRDLVCGQMMIDSGAFTAFTKGRTISLDAYAEYLQKWAGCWDHAITLDVIGDPAQTAANTRTLHARGLRVLPVFTKGGTLADFDAMVREFGYVAVGGTVGLGTRPQRERVTMLQRRAQDLGGGIHALGVGAMGSLRVARPYSADASSISGAFKFGVVVYFDGREVRCVSLANRARLLQDREHIRNHGIDLESLARTGRMPSRKDDARRKLMQAMSLAYATADEYLKAIHPVPPPNDNAAGPHLYNSVTTQYGNTPVDDVYSTAALDRQLHCGPNLYNSVGAGWLVQAAAGLDRRVHSGAPRVWRLHGRDHHRWCRAKVEEVAG